MRKRREKESREGNSEKKQKILTDKSSERDES
jgi:hypothetical protein